MPRIEWDTLGARNYELGTDRGMLYAEDGSGVVWNGLISVSETPTGGAPREFFIDGEKYLNLSGLEEYHSSVQVVSAPKEFRPCAGWREIWPGIWALNQPPEKFGFSYRTLIANDLLGLGEQYKLHIVYNASAKISDIVHQTIADKPNFSPYSFEITAIPEPFIDYKPSAHFVIDTRRTPAETVERIEDILYGTETTDPRMPTVSELMNILVLGSVVGVVLMKKMIVAITGSTKTAGTVAVGMKKMRLAITGGGKSRATAAVRMKKMSVAISGTGKAVATAAPRMKKAKLAISMTTPFARANTLEGGTNGTTISTANSGAASGNAFDSAQVGGTGGVCAYDNVHAMAGSLAAAVSSSGTAVDPYIGWTVPNLPQIWGRFYVWVPSNPTANWRMAGIYGTAPNVNVRAFLRFTTAGKLVLLDAASTVIWTSTNNIGLGTWIRIEYMIVGHASAGQLSISYYAGSATTATESSGTFTNQNTGGDIGSVIHGIASPQASVAKTWFDNLALSNAGPIGP